MAAAENKDESWLETQRRRQERMRFEVLYMLYDAAGQCVDFPVDVAGFVKRLGVWEDELVTTVEFLAREDYLRFDAHPWNVSVCLTVKGVDYIEKDRGRRRTIRE
jgi:hypothetical protein